MLEPHWHDVGEHSENSEMLRVRHGTFSARLRVRRMNPGGQRGRVVCFHGLASEASEFRILAERLSAEGFETICVDWIGHGDSEWFASSSNYMWDRYVKVVWGIDAVFGSAKTHYIGNSWGAAILFISVVSGSMTLRSCTFVDVPIVTKAAVQNRDGYVYEIAPLTFPDLESAESFLAKRRPDFGAMPDRLAQYYREARFRCLNGVVRFAMDPKVSDATALQVARAFNLTPYMYRLRAFSLFLYGRKSAFRQPKLFDVICRKQTNIIYYDDLDAGHPPSLQKQAEIEPILAFLRRVA